jgi:hypothetical protein
VNTASSAAGHIVGIFNANNTSGTNSIDRNRVYDLFLSTSDLTSTLTGMYLYAGSATYKNNMVNIGNGIASEYSITGLLDATTNNNSFYFNTIRIGGTGVGTTATNTYAFRRTAAGTDSVQNNIFINDRSNASTGGKHYAYHISAATSLTSDYNNIYVGGTGGVLGFSSSDRTTLATWKSGTGKDANSVNTSVTFVSSTDVHLDGASIGDLTLRGTPISQITSDIDGDTRDLTYPYMGADEALTPLPVELVSFTAASQRLHAELKWTTATEVNNYGFEIEKKRMKDEVGIMKWEKIGFVEGSGTTNAPKEYSFTDKNLSAGKYSYRLKQIDSDGRFSYSQSVEVVFGSAPLQFALAQNYPNPFNPSTTIGFTLQESGMTTLKIYDAIGREVATLVNEYLEAGIMHQRLFSAKGGSASGADAAQLSSGMYFARLTSHGKVQIKKLMLMK